MIESIAGDPSTSLGRRLAEITLGIDAFATRVARLAGNDDYEELVPIFIGEDLVVVRPFDDWAAAEDALSRFEDDLSTVENAGRRQFLTQMARSLRTSVKFFSGATVGFVEKVRDLVGVPAELVADDEVEAISAGIDRLLARRGFVNGSLAARVGAWQTSRYLEPDVIPATFDDLMATAKARTDAMIWPTGEYTMRLNAVRGVPWAGRCSFVAANMDMNLDVRVTRSSLKHLVCHEVFPGHATQLISTRDVARSGASPLDALLCTTNAVTGAVQEGIGDQGIELIDWVEDDDDATQIELRRLQTATGSNVAWNLHCAGWTRERAIAYLRDVGFGQESWAIVRTTMAEHPFRGIFLASYWFGNETVRSLRLASREPKRLIDALFREVHSIDSLRFALGNPAG